MKDYIETSKLNTRRLYLIANDSNFKAEPFLHAVVRTHSLCYAFKNPSECHGELRFGFVLRAIGFR